MRIHNMSGVMRHPPNRLRSNQALTWLSYSSLVNPCMLMILRAIHLPIADRSAGSARIISASAASR